MISLQTKCVRRRNMGNFNLKSRSSSCTKRETQQSSDTYTQRILSLCTSAVASHLSHQRTVTALPSTKPRPANSAALRGRDSEKESGNIRPEDTAMQRHKKRPLTSANSLPGGGCLIPITRETRTTGYENARYQLTEEIHLETARRGKTTQQNPLKEQ